MAEKSKVSTFIGFAIKSRKYKTGENSVQTLKRANLIIVCKTASDNTVKKAEAFAKRFSCPLIATRENALEKYVYKNNVKIMAITDKNLAEAVMANLEEEFIVK